LDIQAALESLGENASPTTVMRYLRNLVRKPDTSVVGLAPDGVIWRRHHGEVEKLTKKNLADRLRRRRKRAGTR
jgi:hypothetical protein